MSGASGGGKRIIELKESGENVYTMRRVGARDAMYLCRITFQLRTEHTKMISIYPGGLPNGIWGTEEP